MAQEETPQDTTPTQTSQPRTTGKIARARRDFLYYATAGAGAVATGAAVWPLVNSMNPSADVSAVSTIEGQDPLILHRWFDRFFF